MKKRITATEVLASLMAVMLPASSFAQSMQDDTEMRVNGVECCCPPILPKNALLDCQLAPGYGQYGGVEVDCGANLFFYGNFMYWTVQKLFNTIGLLHLNDADNTIETLCWDYKYRPGFTVGAGVNLPGFDNWTLGADYTWYHHDFTFNHGTTGAETLTLTTITDPLFYLPFGLSFSSMQIKDTYDYDEMNLYIQRAFYLGKRVILNPLFGLKGILLQMNSDQTYTENAGFLFNPASAGLILVQTARQKMWALGLANGFDGTFYLGSGFSLLGKARVGLLYLRATKYEQTITQPGQPNLVQNFARPASELFPYAEGGMGFSWGDYFSSNRYHADFAATYDFRMLDIHDAQPVSFANAQFYHGLTVHAKFDF